MQPDIKNPKKPKTGIAVQSVHHMHYSVSKFIMANTLKINYAGASVSKIQQHKY